MFWWIIKTLWNNEKPKRGNICMCMHSQKNNNKSSENEIEAVLWNVLALKIKFC